MTDQILRFIDFFMHPKTKDNFELRYGYRFMVCIIFLFCLLDLYTFLFIPSVFTKYPVITFLYGLVVLLLIICVRFSANYLFLANYLLSICAVVSFVVITNSGGFYSYAMKWIIFIILFSIIFNKKNNIWMPFIWSTITFVIIFYFYFVSNHPSENEIIDTSNLNPLLLTQVSVVNK